MLHYRRLQDLDDNHRSMLYDTLSFSKAKLLQLQTKEITFTL